MIRIQDQPGQPAVWGRLQFDQALADFLAGGGTGRRAGQSVLLAVALTNEGDALNALGRLTRPKAVPPLDRDLSAASSPARCASACQSGGSAAAAGAAPPCAAAYEEVMPLAHARSRSGSGCGAGGLSTVLIDTDQRRRCAGGPGPAGAVGPFATSPRWRWPGPRWPAETRPVPRGWPAGSGFGPYPRDRAGVARALEVQAETCSEWQRAARYLSRGAEHLDRTWARASTRTG